MSANPSSAKSSSTRGTNLFAPFRSPSFSVIWTATVVSNVGGWMYSAAAGWLMTSLTSDALIVSMVQVASTIPLFLFAIPAGALADIVDKRKFLIAAEIMTAVIATIFAGIVWAGAANPANLLLFTFLIGMGSALTMPAWQAIVPQLVTKKDLSPAIAANSVGVNVSRAIGPALGGELAAGLGIAAPFLLNAISNLGVIGALLWWRPPAGALSRLPVERFNSAIRAGLRHTRNNLPLRATMVRSVAFYLFASAYWALLPLVARRQISGGPQTYGILLATIGASAVVGAFLLPWLKARFGPDRLVAYGTIGTAASMVLFGLARTPAPAMVASVFAGASWIAVLSSLNVSAQVALPEWVRARGLAVVVTIFFGALSLGSAIWGQVAFLLGLPMAHFIAAAGAVTAIPLTWRWKLEAGAALDLTPSMHWPAPIIEHDIDADQGPVLVMTEYYVDLTERAPFLAALEKLSLERRRDGAYAWGIFEDAAEEGRIVEVFVVDSWLEHLRQHERVTNADRVIQDSLQRFHMVSPPKVTHLIGISSDRARIDSTKETRKLSP